MILLYVMDIDLNKVEIIPVEEPPVVKAPVETKGGGDIITQILVIALMVVGAVFVSSLLAGSLNSKADDISKKIQEESSVSTSTTGDHSSNEFNPNK
jgi:FlaG/FlaF family flagellin (archaellin)